MAVSLAISETFSVKEWLTLKSGSGSRSRSLKMTPFDRPYTTFYLSAIVTIALFGTIFELFTLIISWLWNMAQKSLTVIRPKACAIRELGCGFLFTSEMTMGHTFWPVTHVTHQSIDPGPAWPVTRDSSRVMTPDYCSFLCNGRIGLQYLLLTCGTGVHLCR